MATTDPRCFCEQCKKSGALPAFVLVTGNDDFLMIEASDEIRQCARDLGYLDREVFEMNGNSDWSQVTMSAADVGMFADQKVVDVRIPGGKIGRKGPDGLQKLLSQPYDGVCVLFTVPTPDWATAKAAWWQNLQKALKSSPATHHRAKRLGVGSLSDFNVKGKVQAPKRLST